MVMIDHTANHKIEHELDTPVNRALKGKGLVVEFIGPTGSGKTTNCRSFAQKLIDENLTVWVFRDLKEYYYRLSVPQKSLLILKTLKDQGRNMLLFPLMLARHGIYNMDSIFRYTKLCFFNTVLDRVKEEGAVDIFLFDQWVIQGLWSATLFKLDSYEQIHRELQPFYFKSDVVLYFDIDPKTASERIELRETHKSRFDRMSMSQRESAARKYNVYLMQLYQNSSCRNKSVLSTRLSPDLNAEIFHHQLMNEFIFA